MQASEKKQSGHSLVFLGTGAGCGVPAFFCECPACLEAKENPRARRGCCGVVLEGEKRLLIDTPPDLRHQFIREEIKGIDKLIYTHAHFDHLGGLGELEYFIRLVRKAPLDLGASEKALAGVEQEFGYMSDCFSFETIAPFDSFEYDGVSYTALPVTHAAGTYGYLIETEDTKIFYACDTGTLPEETAERVRGCDALIMDATFWKKNWSQGAHHSIQETIEEGLALQAKTVYLTHLAMHYDEPITLEGLEKYLERYEGRIKVAYDGLRLDF